MEQFLSLWKSFTISNYLSKSNNAIYTSQGKLEGKALKPSQKPDLTGPGSRRSCSMCPVMTISFSAPKKRAFPVDSFWQGAWFPQPGRVIGGFKNVSMFATDQHDLTYPAAQHPYNLPGTIFNSNGETPQKSSHSWTTLENIPGDSRGPGTSYLRDGLSRTESSYGTILLPVVQSTVGSRSLSGSMGIQDISNYDMSRGQGSTVFQCRREECHGKRFARQSELQRHEDRHSRPFICPVSSCNKKDFADKGSLQRHSREVHKSAKYFCPVVQCERHKRGFGRKYNLIGHNRRVHRGAALDLMSSVSEDAYGNSFEQDDDAHHSGDDGRGGLGDEDYDDVESPEDMSSPVVSGRAEKLKHKLRKLRATKNEHDMAGDKLSKEIQAVERLLLDAIM